MTQMNADQRDPETYAVIGAAMETHRTLGCGFLEAVYQEALAIEFQRRSIFFRREAAMEILYKAQKLSTVYRVDFICFDSIIVELKALSQLSGTEESQIINYLKVSNISRGLLLNFGAQRLEHRRFILSNSHLRQSASSV